MFGFITKIFIGLLTSIVNASSHTKCVSLSNQKCQIQPTRINLHHNKYSQELHYYPFVINLYRCVGSCNTLNVLSNKVCLPNKTEDLNLHMFSMIIGINESKTLTKHISCKCKCKFHGHGRKCNSNQSEIRINVGVSVKIKKNVFAKKIIFGILLHIVVKMENI